MRTIRRLYLYLVAFISLEVVLWGLIGLARSFFDPDVIGNNAARLAGALSLILVGIPVFLLHWWLAQRTSQQEGEEYFSQTRAIFLYGALLATLIPIFQNLLSLLSRILLGLFNLPATLAFIGSDQTWHDNLIAVLMNGLLAGYLYQVLLKDWDKEPQGSAFSDTRRLYRFVWLIYGLVTAVIGVQNILQFLLERVETLGNIHQALIPNGLALLLLGIPVWVYMGRLMQAALAEPGERQSLLRRVFLYAISLVGLAGLLIPTGMILDVILRVLLGETLSIASFLNEISEPFSAALPLGVIWLYYGRILRAEVDALDDTPRRAALRRLYYYILAAFGLGSTLIGIEMLLAYLLEGLLSPPLGSREMWNDPLAAALATLLVGLPLWILSWRPLVSEAARAGESGDHARRSLVRKIYLYLALFSGVIGVMVSAGMLIYALLRALLGDRPPDMGWQVANNSKSLLLFAVLLSYHWQILRSDGRKAEASLAARHADYPVLILTSEIGEFSERMIHALQREVEAMPVAVHMVDNGAPDESLSAARAVIVPGDIAARPSEATRLWLQGFAGQRLIVPTPVDGWLWIFGSGRSLDHYARQTAKLVRQFAEGEEPGRMRETNPWMIVVYIMVSLTVLPMLISLISALAGAIN